METIPFSQMRDNQLNLERSRRMQQGESALGLAKASQQQEQAILPSLTAAYKQRAHFQKEIDDLTKKMKKIKTQTKRITQKRRIALVINIITFFLLSPFISTYRAKLKHDIKKNDQQLEPLKKQIAEKQQALAPLEKSVIQLEQQRQQLARRRQLLQQSQQFS